MNVLVTGAAGFIGSHLAERLAARGDTVVGVDNFNDYYDPARKRRNAEAVCRRKGVMVLEADIRNRARMFELFEEHRFDAVAHIAAMAGVLQRGSPADSLRRGRLYRHATSDGRSQGIWRAVCLRFDLFGSRGQAEHPL